MYYFKLLSQKNITTIMLFIAIFTFLGISLSQRKVESKNKTMTTLAFTLVLIFLIVDLLIVFKLLMNK